MTSEKDWEARIAATLALPAQSHNLPQQVFDTALAVPRRHFRPLIQSFNDMREKKRFYLAMNDISGTETADIPTKDSQRQGLVSQLFSAFYDGSETIDGPGSNPYRAIMEKNYYPEGAVHLMLWELLECIENAQRGKCDLPTWYTANGPAYQTCESFVERFAAVLTALKESKASCCSLFKDASFAARVAWNPAKEYKRKQTNKDLNTQKNTIQELGHQFCKDLGIHRNSEGILQDKDGNMIPGKQRVPTTLFQRNSGRVKKRPHQSERAKVAQRLFATGRQSGLEQEPEPLEELHTSPTTLHGVSLSSGRADQSSAN
ncbi:hypothetical protein HD806DRAFT_538734 [Xylariaceae sp. AK1471]|nr:hypothetical protein HD806DRAFT_538734 [Xylariaceae sp. AK1471]